MKLHILSALLVALPISGFAQTLAGSTSQAVPGALGTRTTSQTEQAHVGPWSLAECIDYALSHNITVQQQDISMQQKAIDLNTAQNALLPDLSANVSQNYSFGRGLSSENLYVNTNTASTGANLGSSINLFNGFRAMQTIKLNQINLQAATADLEKAKNDIRMNVAQAYVQILYDMEILDVARRQISIDSLQVERLKHMLASGKASSVEVSQQEATLGQSRYTMTQAFSNLQLAVLGLTQLLEFPSPEGFSVTRPSVSADAALLGSPDEIYSHAVGSRPDILAEQYRLDGTHVSLKIAKSALYPSLNLSGGIGSNYYKSSGYNAAAFGEQMKNNFSQYVSLSLSIPIFNRFATRNSIRSAELSKQNQSLQLENMKKSLYKEIQQAYYNAVAAQDKYLSSKQAVSSAESSFKLVSAKYENGKANITEFNESKNSYLKSESDYVQSIYEFLYQSKLLDFYKGQPLTL